jgi:uncharacterized protein (DUF736 family)
MTTQLRKMAGTDAPQYRVSIDGTEVGTVYAPDRECGETYWTARLDGVARAVSTCAGTRKEAVEMVEMNHRLGRATR